MKKILKINRLLSFILRFSVIVISGFLAFGLFTVAMLNKKIGPSYAYGISILAKMQNQLPLIISITAIVQALALCAIVMLFILIWLHSIAGPLTRFRKYLKKISEGKFPKEPLVFRESDQLHGLAQAFSDMAIAYKENCAKALTLLADAQKIINECDMLRNNKTDNKRAYEYVLKLDELKSVYAKIKTIYMLHKTD